MGNVLPETIIDYAKPPVIEVVCSVQFQPLPALHAACVGRYWEQVRGDFPIADPKPPIIARTETFPQPTAPAQLQLELVETPPVRLMMVGQEPNWVVQVQPDRFLLNWRREQSNYVRFPTIAERFFREFTRFRTFVSTLDNASLAINQLELTHVNHVPQGEGWQTLADLGNVFPDTSVRSGNRFLPSPETLVWKAVYPLPEQQGRLHATIQHAVRMSDQQKVLLCELTARGMPTSDDDSSVQSWFGMSREWIVRGFADLASEQVQQDVWGRKA